MNREQGGQLVRQVLSTYAKERQPSSQQEFEEWNREMGCRVFDAVSRAVRAEIKADPKCPNCESNQASANETTALLGRVMAHLERYEQLLKHAVERGYAPEIAEMTNHTTPPQTDQATGFSGGHSPSRLVSGKCTNPACEMCNENPPFS